MSRCRYSKMPCCMIITFGLKNNSRFNWIIITPEGKIFARQVGEVLVLGANTKSFMKHASGSVAPVLFLLSDGEPTDDYKAGLQKLKANNRYKIAVRVASQGSTVPNSDEKV